MVRERISRVRNYREKSPGASGRSLAATPQAFHVTVVPNEPFLAFAEVSSERREYAPVGWMGTRRRYLAIKSLSFMMQSRGFSHFSNQQCI